MSMIRINDLSFSYPTGIEAVFEHVSFQIDSNWRLGLIGRNGRGKTTLLYLLAGKYPYQGTIQKSVSCAYFPYTVDSSGTTEEVIKSVAPDAFDWEIQIELSHLDLKETLLTRSFLSLSNGERSKVLLAGLFLKKEGFLLIDEPTNHLDQKGREVVADYLKKKKGFIVVSHDRSFLDACIDHVLILNRQTIDVQNGNFSSWYTNFNRQQQYEKKEAERLKKDVRRLQQSFKQSQSWSDQTEASKYGNGPVDRGFIGHKAAKMMKRAKTIETRKEKALKTKQSLLKDYEETEQLRLSPLIHRSQQLVSFSDVVITYDQKAVHPPISFTITAGMRLALAGKNGSGKSSLLRLLIGEEIPYSGLIKRAPGLIISYVGQDLSHLKGSLSSYAEAHHLNESLLKSMLRKLDFKRSLLSRNIEEFSDGQKKKVLLAASLLMPAHLYVWDEPLNYIDVFSRMQIETLILESKASMIFVEHDQTFQQKIATDIIRL